MEKNLLNSMEIELDDPEERADITHTHKKKTKIDGQRPNDSDFMASWEGKSFDTNNMWFLVLDAMKTIHSYKNLDGNEKKRWVIKTIRSILSRPDQEVALEIFDVVGETTIDFIVFLSKHKKTLLNYPCGKCLPF